MSERPSTVQAKSQLTSFLAVSYSEGPRAMDLEQQLEKLSQKRGVQCLVTRLAAHDALPSLKSLHEPLVLLRRAKPTKKQLSLPLVGVLSPEDDRLIGVACEAACLTLTRDLSLLLGSVRDGWADLDEVRRFLNLKEDEPVAALILSDFYKFLVDPPCVKDTVWANYFGVGVAELPTTIPRRLTQSSPGPPAVKRRRCRKSPPSPCASTVLQE